MFHDIIWNIYTHWIIIVSFECVEPSPGQSTEHRTGRSRVAQLFIELKHKGWTDGSPSPPRPGAGGGYNREYCPWKLGWLWYCTNTLSSYLSFTWKPRVPTTHPTLSFLSPPLLRSRNQFNLAVGRADFKTSTKTSATLFTSTVQNFSF